ncbi:phosphatidylinositol-specific phospholipase C domain-containing protein [Kitasatospora cineracea]|uniref:phosphatidylinositol-specific phospholipase C domain-containing protein n=1 Tax=Kitasatospora cineracea TaxID=88074 RepID=UPI00380F8F65
MPRTIGLSRPFARTALFTRLRRAAVAMAAVAGLAAASLTVAQPAAAMGSSNADAYRSINSTRHPDWMSMVNGNTWLAAMSIPGTHETMAIQDGVYVQTQEDHGTSGGSLANQLERGIRALDIRVRVIDNGFTIHHGSYYQDAVFDDVLIRTRDFLSAHSGETVLMRLHSECAGGIKSCTDSPDTTAQGDRVRIFLDYVKKYPGLFYAPSVREAAPGAGYGTPTGVPRLKDVRGKIVLTNFEGPGGGDYGFGINGYNEHREDHYDVSGAPERWNYAKANLDKAAADTSGNMFVTYTSGTRIPALAPSDFASGYLSDAGAGSRVEGVNSRLMKYLNSGGGNADHIGVVMMDFPGWALIDDIVYRNPSQIWSAWQSSSSGSYCLDDYQSTFSPGARVSVWACNGGGAQQWTLIGNTIQIGSVSRPGGALCLDISQGGTTNGAPVQLWGCNGGANQQWTLNGKSQLVNPQSGRCLDIPGGRTDGTQLDIWDCVDGAKNEVWYHA